MFERGHAYHEHSCAVQDKKLLMRTCQAQVRPGQPSFQLTRKSVLQSASTRASSTLIRRATTRSVSSILRVDRCLAPQSLLPRSSPAGRQHAHGRLRCCCWTRSIDRRPAVDTGRRSGAVPMECPSSDGTLVPPACPCPSVSISSFFSSFFPTVSLLHRCGVQGHCRAHVGRGAVWRYAHVAARQRLT
jgi:hypothetical protein